MTILNTTFNLHVFPMDGYYTPIPSDFDSLPYPQEGVWSYFFDWKVNAKDGVTITFILYPVNLGILVLRCEN